MFKGSGQINPQALKNDYSGIERAAGIKANTLASLGKAIEGGFKAHKQKKEDKAEAERALELTGIMMEQMGYEGDPEAIKAVMKNAGASEINKMGDALKEITQYQQKADAALLQQNKDRRIQRMLANQAQQRLDATAATAGPKEVRVQVTFENEQADRKALSDTVSMAAQRGWNLKTTMESYHRSGGKDDMAVHEAWVKMNPNMKPEIATLEDKDGNEHELILWNGQMRPVADLTKTERTSAAAEAIEKSDLKPEQKTKLWTKIANLLGSNEESDSIKALRIVMEAGMVPIAGGGGSSEAPEVLNINDLSN